jgi:hypothetical protein
MNQPGCLAVEPRTLLEALAQTHLLGKHHHYVAYGTSGKVSMRRSLMSSALRLEQEGQILCLQLNGRAILCDSRDSETKLTHTGGRRIGAAFPALAPSPRAADREYIETGAHIGAGKYPGGLPESAKAGSGASLCAGRTFHQCSSSNPLPNSGRGALPR